MAELASGQAGPGKESPAGATTTQTTGASAQVEQTTSEKAVLVERRAGPIVVRLKKKKRRYSRGLKDLQKALRRGTKAGDRLSDAIASGISRYRRRADRSASTKKDGMLTDFFKNSARGMGTTLRRSSKVPTILSGAISRKTIKRQVRLARTLLGDR